MTTVTISRLRSMLQRVDRMANIIALGGVPGGIGEDKDVVAFSCGWGGLVEIESIPAEDPR